MDISLDQAKRYGTEAWSLKSCVEILEIEFLEHTVNIWRNISNWKAAGILEQRTEAEGSEWDWDERPMAAIGLLFRADGNEGHVQYASRRVFLRR